MASFPKPSLAPINVWLPLTMMFQISRRRLSCDTRFATSNVMTRDDERGAIFEMSWFVVPKKAVMLNTKAECLWRSPNFLLQKARYLSAILVKRQQLLTALSEWANELSGGERKWVMTGGQDNARYRLSQLEWTLVSLANENQEKMGMFVLWLEYGMCFILEQHIVLWYMAPLLYMVLLWYLFLV